MTRLPRCIVLAMRFLMAIAMLCAMGCAGTAKSPPSQHLSALDSAAVRRELQHRYDENRRAFLAKDFNAIMALRTAVTADSVLHYRAEMEQSTRALLDGIDRWISLTFEIDSLEVSGDLARAVVRQ